MKIKLEFYFYKNKSLGLMDEAGKFKLNCTVRPQDLIKKFVLIKVIQSK